MRTIAGIVVSSALLFVAQLASAQSDVPRAIDNFNKFQQFVQAKNIDSAFQNAQELASRNVQLLNGLIHNSFAQSFGKEASARVDTASVRQLLQRMYGGTSNRALQQSVYPLYQWVESRNVLNDPAKIRQLIAGFLTAQERSPEEQGNRIDRYALLIYELLRQKPAYSALADTLFGRTYQRLEHAVNGIYFQSTDDRIRSQSRAYFRYVTAYANFVKAKEAMQHNDSARAETYLAAASQFSPDENDRLAKSAYFYETAMLLNDVSLGDFHKPYADFLLAKGDTDAAIKVLTELALADPGTIETLKLYYAKAPVRGQSFSQYWTQALNQKLKPAEPFRLTDLNGKPFDYEQYKGKWILIDFWGTWCKPCVAELPHFQKFYTELARNNRQDLVVITAACHDIEPRVRAFMQKQAYTFPVAMVDDTFIKQFRVMEYPTKVLITPQGNRMKIPSGSQWAERVRIYTEN